MESTVRKYSRSIADRKVRVHVPYDGKKSGLVIDPSDPVFPVDFLGFGIYRLADGPFELASGDRELAFIPTEGRFRLTVDGRTFEGSREAGMFAGLPERSNAQAVYVPAGSEVRIEGDGEIAFFSAPASGRRPAALVRAEDGTTAHLGAGTWRRDVLLLVSPETASTNLTAGETYSPAGHWSGTPLHTHDKDDLANGQSDHEEIYYHRFRLQKREPFGAYGVQFLFDGRELNEAYVIRDRSVIAIPGVCHPVVTGPVSDHVYLYGLASRKGAPLAMHDVTEFRHLKAIAKVLEELEAERGTRGVTADRLARFKELETFSSYQRELMGMVLRERGFRITRQ